MLRIRETLPVFVPCHVIIAMTASGLNNRHASLPVAPTGTRPDLVGRSAVPG